MKGYNYIYLLISEYDHKVDAIIYTNKITEVVEQAIQEAIKEYHALEIDYSQTLFILDSLSLRLQGKSIWTCRKVWSKKIWKI